MAEVLASNSEGACSMFEGLTEVFTSFMEVQGGGTEGVNNKAYIPKSTSSRST